MNKTSRELFVSFVILLLSYIFFSYYDVLEMIVSWSNKYEAYEIDEIFSCIIVLAVLAVIFSVKRWREVAEKNRQLQEALNEIKVLQGIIPICSYCKKIRDDAGVWKRLELYIQSHSNAAFSHGVCPECYQKQVDELELMDK